MEKIEKNCDLGECTRTGMYFHIATIVLLVAAIAASLWAGAQPAKMETLKVGGQENFEKLEKIMKSEAYKEQYAQSLDLMLQQLEGTQPDSGMVYPGDEVSEDDMNINVNSGDTISGDINNAQVIQPTENSQTETVLPTTDSNEIMGN